VRGLDLGAGEKVVHAGDHVVREPGDVGRGGVVVPLEFSPRAADPPLVGEEDHEPLPLRLKGAEPWTMTTAGWRPGVGGRWRVAASWASLLL